ncbi:TPA: type II toxin-antitoxin system VapC family toxin [bacterium]|nr:type II toxin-antitoxin system VapC family toxin [bacterium]
MKADGSFLLDTSVIIAIFGGDDSVSKNIMQANGILVPSIAIGELYYGAYKSGKVMKNINQVEEFAIGNSILYCDVNTANEYGFIKNHLRKKGAMIPDNDIWISAIAKQHNLIIATRDQHFANMCDLIDLEIW